MRLSACSRSAAQMSSHDLRIPLTGISVNATTAAATCTAVATKSVISMRVFSTSGPPIHLLPAVRTRRPQQTYPIA